VAIAQEAGLHHSAVLRYFPSRDAVLLRLAEDGWASWADRFAAQLGGEPASTDRVADVLVDTLVVDELFCDLLGNVPLQLEHGVEGDALLAFKRAAMASAGRIAAAIAAAAPELGAGGARSLMTAANSLAATLWQICNPSPPLAAIYEREPELGHPASEFAPILRRLLSATARGLVATPARARSGAAGGS
jgi:AcrR family transcriptional regulator